MTSTPDLAAPFLQESIRLLEDDYMPRIRRALERLPDSDLWWRPNDASNSPGNLLLHLAGNLRQWVVSGVGEEPDTRRRTEEFAADGHPEPLAVLEEAVREAAAVLRTLDPDRLAEPITVQNRAVTRHIAIYHAIEHFAMHTGQILWIAKERAGEDLGLYDDGAADGHPRRLW